MIEDEEVDKFIKEYLKDKRVVEKTLVSLIPSMKQLFRVLRKNGIFIDSRDTTLKTMLRKAYRLKNEDDFNRVERLAYFSLAGPIETIQDHEERIHALENKEIKKGSLVFCNHIDYGVGEVDKLFTDDLMAVKFQNRPIRTMCNSKTMTTVHDDISRKLRLM